MKILLIGPVPIEVGGDTQGGIASHVWGLATHLTKNGHQVAVLGDNTISRHAKSISHDGVRLYKLQDEFRAALSRQIFRRVFWRKFRQVHHYFEGVLQGRRSIFQNLLTYLRVIEDFQPDVIHVHRLQNQFVYAHFVAYPAIPIVASVHSAHAILYSKESTRQNFQRLIAKNLDHVQHLIFVSEFTKRQYESLFRPDLPNPKVIYNPFDSNLFCYVDQAIARQQVGQDNSTKLIISVGSLIYRKGFDVLIEAAARLSQSAKVLIVGDGLLRDELTELIHRKNLDHRIVLVGEKTQVEMVDYYNAADLFVLASRMESFGLVFFEAMLCGCPVVGTPDVLTELLPSEDYGFKTPIGDVEALTLAIERALAKNWEREKIRNYAIRYEWSKQIHLFEQFYREISEHNSVV